MITEPDVTLTDYALALESGFFAYLLSYRIAGQREPLRKWFVLFFGAGALAAFAGGTVHGFYLDEQTPGYRILWPATLLAIGLAALSTWSIAARVQFSERVARWISLLAVLEFFAYSFVILFIAQNFAVAVANYLPAAVFLLVVLAAHYRRERVEPMRIGLFGLVLSFLAAAIQQCGIGLHPVYFSNNALYHVIQAVALFMIFWAARWLVTTEPTLRR
jgi:hypothetical protein